MKLKKRRQLLSRERFLSGRIKRTTRRIEARKKAGKNKLLGPLKRWVEKELKAGNKAFKDADRDESGKIEFDELVYAIERWLDKKIEPKDPIYEWLSDVGLHVAAFVAAAIYRGTDGRLKRRLKRDEQMLEAVREALGKKSSKKKSSKKSSKKKSSKEKSSKKKSSKKKSSKKSSKKKSSKK